MSGFLACGGIRYSTTGSGSPPVFPAVPPAALPAAPPFLPVPVTAADAAAATAAIPVDALARLAYALGPNPGRTGPPIAVLMDRISPVT